ncbi:MULTISPECIES: hypothetical protein [unclassified Rhizobium]|uniref:hypothetical protein n=1 Tax=unclassified Rhizobium TaxID=2613769 RepID=UPI0011602087|nr:MULTISPECIES: hypothetical protein [unclassified Rhizobium]TQX87151.1 hypothetical protein EQW76_14930 [Rhizobium sp. rho-13.1]TQY14226.1 hypothetical protein EQW74_13690 [Rhizobium sp. rho-1.1]
MYDFGILTARPETVDMQLPDGSLTAVKISVLYNNDGVEWHDVFRDSPTCDYYVALDSKSRVVSMEADPEHSQIAGHRIVGLTIAETSGYTRGEGGNVYGKQWNGTALGDPVLSRDEFVPLSPAQLRKTLVRRGYSLAVIQSAIDGMPEGPAKDEAQIDWEFAESFERLNPTLLAVAAALSITDDQIDEMWEQALAS